MSVRAEHVPPHSGRLVDLVLQAEHAKEVLAEAIWLPSWTLSERQECDLELLAHGGFSPLEGFLCRRDYDAVLGSMRLASGLVWPIPVTLGVNEALARELERSRRLALRDAEGNVVAVVEVEDLWEPNRQAEAEAVFGTASAEHAGVAQFLAEEGTLYVGGRVRVITPPSHFDFTDLRHTPRELRQVFAERGWSRVVAFQTRNPMHRAHYELTVRALNSVARGLGAGDWGLGLLIHPAVGATREADIDHYTRVRCYKAILPRYPEGTAMLSLLPLAMRLAGPREALWHAIIRKNYGCTHMIV
ncbi:MAG: sulfate adenylyltransferase, partial [Gemmatimonadetes bacterium]|nr:sulfate adenylyltransferase [Gemmatimonadota bacterium]